MRVARCIPPDKIDWTYAPAKFTLPREIEIRRAGLILQLPRQRKAIGSELGIGNQGCGRAESRDGFVRRQLQTTCGNEEPLHALTGGRYEFP